MGFETFIGNPGIVERLRTKLREDRLPHAMIFSGPAGVGKRTLVSMLAKALNCEVNNADFCDVCSQCHKISAGTHPDMFTFAVQEDATKIKVEQVRELTALLNYRPLEGRNKVFIIDPAELMSPAAETALLKGLEEPPPNTYFFLLTVNVHDLLGTVRSRSQIYHFSPLTASQLRQYGITDELAVRWSRGSAGLAKSLNLESLRSERAAVLGFLQGAATASEEQLAELLAAAAEMSRSKDRNVFLDRVRILSALVGDLLYLKEGAEELLVNVDIAAELRGLSRVVTTDQLVRVADFLGDIELFVKGNVNRQMMADVLALMLNPETSASIRG